MNVSSFKPLAVDDRPVAGDRAHRPVDRQHRAGRVEQGALKRCGGADGADLTQIGCCTRAVAVHPVARRAGAGPPEKGAATHGVTQAHVADIHVAHRSQKRHEAGQLGRREVVRGHRGVGDTPPEQSHQLRSPNLHGRTDRYGDRRPRRRHPTRRDTGCSSHCRAGRRIRCQPARTGPAWSCAAAARPPPASSRRPRLTTRSVALDRRLVNTGSRICGVRIVSVSVPGSVQESKTVCRGSIHVVNQYRTR